MQLDPRLTDNHFTGKLGLKLVPTKGIDNENILDLLLGDYAKSMLESIKTCPKSTLQLCEELEIPPSTAYRITQKLYNYGLVQRTYTINSAGRKMSMYKIRFGGIQCQ
ncbi:MAG: helix-turn-helix domain-containing protein [Nitrosotalea sp.]